MAVKTARVLIVEDDPYNSELLSQALAQRGHLVATASSADEAASALGSGAYDFILLDHILPGATGMQSIRMLRALSRAPIYMMSGQGDADTKKDALLLGADGFFSKPFKLDDIFRAIEQTQPSA